MVVLTVSGLGLNDCIAEGEKYDAQWINKELDKVYKNKQSPHNLQKKLARLLDAGEIKASLYLGVISSLYYQKKISQEKMTEALLKTLAEIKRDFDDMVKTTQTEFQEAAQKEQTLAGEKMQKYDELLVNYKKEANERLNIIDQKIAQAEKTTDPLETKRILEEISVKMREVRGFQVAAMKNLAGKHGRLSGDVPEEAPIEKKEFIKTETNQ